MSLILNIDTATETAQVSFAKDGKLLQSLHNDSQKDHASFLQVAIQQLMEAAAASLIEKRKEIFPAKEPVFFAREGCCESPVVTYKYPSGPNLIRPPL